LAWQLPERERAGRAPVGGLPRAALRHGQGPVVAVVAERALSLLGADEVATWAGAVIDALVARGAPRGIAGGRWRPARRAGGPGRTGRPGRRSRATGREHQERKGRDCRPTRPAKRAKERRTHGHLLLLSVHAQRAFRAAPAHILAGVTLTQRGRKIRFSGSYTKR
jgi:hypothetical protein